MNVQLAVCANELDRPARSRNLTIDRFTSTDVLATLVCHGRLTVETGSLFKSEVKSLSPHFLYVMADLSDVDFVDASGLGDVLAAFVSARSAGCELKLINVHPRVKDLLNMARLSSVLEDRVWKPGSPPLCRTARSLDTNQARCRSQRDDTECGGAALDRGAGRSVGAGPRHERARVPERLHLVQEATTLRLELAKGTPPTLDFFSLMPAYCGLGNAERALNDLVHAREHADAARPYVSAFKVTSPSLIVLRELGFCYESLGNAHGRTATESLTAPC